jgi:hypothetical protein
MAKGFTPAGTAETVISYVNEMITNLTGIKYNFMAEFSGI